MSTFLADDTTGPDIEAAAEAARQAAYDATYTWLGRELFPWSIGREQLYFKLRAVSGTVPLALALQNAEAFLGDAMIVLYLCSHEPQAWRQLRSNLPLFLEAIEQWADTAIPRLQQSQAVDLAIQIVNDAKLTRAIPQPSGRESEAQLGN